MKNNEKQWNTLHPMAEEDHIAHCSYIASSTESTTIYNTCTVYAKIPHRTVECRDKQKVHEKTQKLHVMYSGVVYRSLPYRPRIIYLHVLVCGGNTFGGWR
jgi:hypothetical protein